MSVEEVATTEGQSKVYSLDEVQKHMNDKDCWLVVHGKVYDITEFLDEHPGGYDIIIQNTGKDSTEDFEEIGHSKAAVEMLDKYLIGTFAGGDPSATKPRSNGTAIYTEKSSMSSSLLKALLPILILLAAVFVALQAK